MEHKDPTCSLAQDYALELNSDNFSNGSLKRLAPLAIFTSKLDLEDTEDLIK